MGNPASTMRATMEENQAKMMEMQRSMALKQRETQMALEIAKAKDRFQFYTGFYVTVMSVAFVGGIVRHNPLPFVAIGIPTTWAWYFQYDLLHGNKMDRIMAETNRLLLEEPHRFAPPKASLLLSDPEYYEHVIMPERRERNALMKPE